LLTEALVERGPRKKVRWEIDVVRASFPEYLVDLPAIQEAGLTKGRLNAVDRMIGRVIRAALCFLAGFRVPRQQNGTNRQMIVAAHRDAQRTSLVADLDPIRLFQIHYISASVAKKEAGLIQAVTKHVAHLHLELLLVIGYIFCRKLGNAAAVETPAL